MSRPLGIFWARTGPRPGDRLCTAMAHDVYRRPLVRPKLGAPGEVETVEIFACAVCWPERRSGTEERAG